jgi:hypothetical protein
VMNPNNVRSFVYVSTINNNAWYNTYAM